MLSIRSTRLSDIVDSGLQIIKRIIYSLKTLTVKVLHLSFLSGFCISGIDSSFLSVCGVRNGPWSNNSDILKSQKQFSKKK